jgi:hypothetical protein
VFIFNERATDTTVQITQVVFNKQYGIIKYVTRSGTYILNREEALTEVAQPVNQRSRTL